MAAHKEFRFLLPVLPLGFMYSGRALSELQLLRPRLYRWAVGATLLANAVAAGYLSLVHQRAPISAIAWIRTEAAARGSGVGTPMSVHFLTNCHATPFHSQVHAPSLAMEFLDCSPPARGVASTHPLHFSLPLRCRL